MRASLVARYVSHPAIDFGSGRRAAGHRARLGLGRSLTTYHRPRRVALTVPTVATLRRETSRFSFPTIGRTVRLPARRVTLPFGLPRARRA
jgi:hypothetical protein